MGFSIKDFHEKCAKSHLGAADEHAELAKCHHQLANKSTSDDDHASIARCHERLADHHADIANEHTRAARALGATAINMNDDSEGIDSLKAAAAGPVGKFGMAATTSDEELRKRTLPPLKSDSTDLSKVDSEFVDLFKV